MSSNCYSTLDYIEVGKLIDPVYTGTVYLTREDTVNIRRPCKL